MSRRAKESREEVSSVRKRAIWILSWLLAAALLQTGCEPGRQTEKVAESEAAMRISIESDTQSIVFQLNDSSAAKSLYDQLPLTATVENFGGNEKIFYPPEPLEVSGTPMAEGPAGTLAYYEPWGDVAIFLWNVRQGGRPVCVGRSDFRRRTDRSSCGGNPNRKGGKRASGRDDAAERRSRADRPGTGRRDRTGGECGNENKRAGRRQNLYRNAGKECGDGGFCGANEKCSLGPFAERLCRL